MRPLEGPLRWWPQLLTVYNMLPISLWRRLFCWLVPWDQGVIHTYEIKDGSSIFGKGRSTSCSWHPVAQPPVALVDKVRWKGKGAMRNRSSRESLPPISVVWKTTHAPSCLSSSLLFILPISPCYEVLSIKNIKGLFQKYCCDCLHMSPLCLPGESAVVLWCLNLICFLSDANSLGV